MEKTLPNHELCQCSRNVPARVIVWEREGSWARHLRRLLTPHGPQVYEARTRRACREMLAENPASIVIAEWTSTASAELIEFVTGVRRRFPAVRMLAVGDLVVEPFRWQMLEAGFGWLCTSPRQLGPVVEIIRRHLDGVSDPPRPPEQRIWDELPWSRI